MFDLSSTKLLLLGIIALLVVGPKDLPAMLRTIGRYVGMIKRQAAEFRTQFDDAMKESEIADLKKQMEDFGNEAQSAVKEAETAFHKEASALESEATKTLAELDKVANADMEKAAPSTDAFPDTAPANGTAHAGDVAHDEPDAPVKPLSPPSSPAATMSDSSKAALTAAIELPKTPERAGV